MSRYNKSSRVVPLSCPPDSELCGTSPQQNLGFNPWQVALRFLFVAACALAFGMGRPAVADNDVVGKVVAGYQGWFACAGDGTPVGSLNRWVHWSRGTTPSPGNQTFELWPDVRDFGRGQTFPTGYANLGDGRPARLYSADQSQVVDTHVRWMRQYGIDCAALQRFGAELADPVYAHQRNEVAVRLRDACQNNGRKFYIMYDISGWTKFSPEVKADWADVITRRLRLTDSPAYARQNGKPVVCLWGMGFTDHPGDTAECRGVIQWFKSQGCYVIGGVPAYWRTSTRDSKPDFLSVYNAFDMLSPWTVGRFNGTAGADDYRKTVLAGDFQYCKAHGIAYQPVVFPGFAWSNWNGGPRNEIPRLHGTFLWRQFANLKATGISTAYVAMFDEFDEGTAIAKAAEDASMIPKNQYFLTLDADGVRVSSDFYLRLVGDGARLLRGRTPPRSSCPTPFTPPRP